MKKHLPKVIGKGINILALIAPKKAAGIALKFFSTPRKGRIRPHQENFLRQFEENLIHSPVGKVATYRKKGSGKRLLLCHGWESNSSRWKKLIAYLERIPDLDILMMDAPGHGKTETPDFSALKYKTMIHSVNQAIKQTSSSDIVLEPLAVLSTYMTIDLKKDISFSWLHPIACN
jgi:hypothetical protein